MHYTVPESMQEVLTRAERVRRKRERKRLSLFSIGVCALMLVLTLSLATAPLAPPDGSEASAMGSFLLEAKSGGIVAAIIIAFFLGVLITLLFIRKRRIEPPESHVQKSDEHKDGGENHE